MDRAFLPVFKDRNALLRRVETGIFAGSAA
jgi:hypothetical protein